jgi:CheY-specific phosphatase CheX
MNSPTTIDDWMSAVVASAGELATVALGFDGASFVAKRDKMPTDLTSAVIALVSDSASVQLGVASTEDGCKTLARALLCMDPGEELPPDDVADAVGEVANIIAGQVKRCIGDQASQVKLGLPLVVHGRFETSDSVETAFADLNVGPVPVTVMVLKSAVD